MHEEIGSQRGDTNLYGYVGTVGIPGALETNLFSYTQNDPINFIDSSGLSRSSLSGSAPGYPEICGKIATCQQQIIPGLDIVKRIPIPKVGLLIKGFCYGLEEACKPRENERIMCDLP
jgi:hypothetical protein